MKYLIIFSLMMGVGMEAHAAKIIGNGRGVGPTGQRSFIYQQRVIRILSRIRGHFPQLAVAVEHEFEDFDNSLSLDCSAQQLAIDDPSRLWNSLDEVNKARLAVYESLCRATQSGAVDDVNAVGYTVDLILQGALKSLFSNRSIDWNFEVDNLKSEDMTGYSALSDNLSNR